MAKSGHLKILEQGVEVWNKWREENPKKKPDFSGADFSGADLRRADLRSATLRNANLRRANLSNTNLSEANLWKTNLSEANLSEANLSKANLNESLLNKTLINKTNLEDTEFKHSQLFDTIFIHVDLGNAKNLELCIHGSPSNVDHQTLAISGKLPLQFLRGVGLPDQFIEYYPSLLSDDVIQYYSCFISYSSNDEEFAKQLHADLQNNGIRCWFALEDMEIGDKIRGKIDEAIRFRDKLLLILSKDSIESSWVESEIEAAFEEEKNRKETILFPTRIDNTVMDTKEAWAANIRRTRHIGDFTDWKNHHKYKKAFDRLLRDLKKESKSS